MHYPRWARGIKRKRSKRPKDIVLLKIMLRIQPQFHNFHFGVFLVLYGSKCSEWNVPTTLMILCLELLIKEDYSATTIRDIGLFVHFTY